MRNWPSLCLVRPKVTTKRNKTLKMKTKTQVTYSNRYLCFCSLRS